MYLSISAGGSGQATGGHYMHTNWSCTRKSLGDSQVIAARTTSGSRRKAEGATPHDVVLAPRTYSASECAEAQAWGC